MSGIPFGAYPNWISHFFALLNNKQKQLKLYRVQQEAQALNQSMNLGLQLQLQPRLKAGRSVGIYQRGRMNSYFYVSLSTTIKIG